MSESRKHIFDSLMDYMADRPVISTHSHHMPDETFNFFSLETLFKNSYVNWCHVPFDGTREGRKAFLDKVRHNSYFVWLKKSLQAIYNTGEAISEENWDEYSRKLKESNNIENYHIDFLKKVCNYEKVVLDAFWKPGSDNGHPELFAPTYRINMFLYGYSTDAKDHNGNNPVLVYGEQPKGMDEYVEFMRRTIRSKKEQGCVALKSALAYDRGLDFTEVSKDRAEHVFKKDRDILTRHDIKHFQDYIFFQICRIAAELELPLQCHTGLGQLQNTSARYMKEVIEKNPDTKFVLFHGGYPWMDDLNGLLHNYSNVYPDICWLPLISTSACESQLEEIIEVGTSDKVCWGCDTWTSEESYGALLAARFVLARVLSGKVEDGYFSLEDARIIADNVLYNNAKRLYKV